MSESGGDSKVKATVTKVVIGVVVAVIAGLLVAWINGDGSSTSGTARGPVRDTPPPSSSASVGNLGPSNSAAQGDSLSSTPSPGLPDVKYLADAEAVSGAFETGTSTIGGNKVDCGKSLLFSLNTFSGHRSAVFNIDPGSTTFIARLGLDQGTENGVKAHFQIYLNDVAINTGYTLDVYSVEDVVISVAGKSRIELTTDGVENGGGTGHVGDATWCDARLTK